MLHHTANQPRYRRGGVTIGILFALLVVALPGCEDQGPTGTDLTTSTEGAQAGLVGAAVDADASAAPLQATASLTSTIPLPINQSKATSGVLFGLTQTGTGPAGFFKINNTSNTKDALLGQTNGGTQSVAVHGLNTGNGGLAGLFESTNGANPRPALGVKANHNGIGLETAVVNPNSSADALRAVSFGTGHAGRFESKSSDETVLVTNTGTGFAAHFKATGSAKGLLIETQGGA